ncbi:CLK4-associating serine/arginine rich protein isoform X3 [Octopus bimaculoides]|uniref:CLK4-associating serine/arginine rich protein isoform X3 n=1 Tax=Octopus bimaculoides TaxID=37653 RepID=UPI0022E07728|nr:CLK4-associating serine/arginine rich protein isoform X3 [Octopus bimaculoides]
MMWHEARKQERKIRGLMVDYKKRAERRREYYEKIKQDPTQFLRVYGRPYKIHLDPAVALSAESPQSMMPWQGQTDNMIDRFDVRAHLDFIPEYKSAPPLPMTKEEEEEERKCSYERYRTLVENECAGLNEEQCLHQIYFDEQFGPIRRFPDDEKRKLADKKAAIGFTYEDSNAPIVREEEEDDSSDTDVETADLDVTLDVDALTPDQLKILNQCAQHYGMHDDDYVRYLRKDKEELEALRQAKLLEEEKAQFAGRKSRRERRAYKEKKLQGRKISPPSYAARASPKYEPYKRSSSSSKSRSRSPENAGKVMYITSFGGESEEEAAAVGSTTQSHSHSHSDRLSTKGVSSSTTGGSSSRNPPWKSSRFNRKTSSSSNRYRHRSRSPAHTQSKYRRRRSRSRSASRSRSRSNPRSHTNNYRRDRWRHTRSRSRSRSRSREWRRSHSNYYNDRGSRNQRSRYQARRRSRSRSSKSSRSSRSRSSSRSKSPSSHSKSRSKTHSPQPKAKPRSKSKSPVQPAQVLPKPVIKRYRRASLSSSAEDSHSDSDSNKPATGSTTETTTTTSASATTTTTTTPTTSTGSAVSTPKTKDSRVPAPNLLGKATVDSQVSDWLNFDTKRKITSEDASRLKQAVIEKMS